MCSIKEAVIFKTLKLGSFDEAWIQYEPFALPKDKPKTVSGKRFNFLRLNWDCGMLSGNTWYKKIDSKLGCWISYGLGGCVVLSYRIKIKKGWDIRWPVNELKKNWIVRQDNKSIKRISVTLGAFADRIFLPSCVAWTHGRTLFDTQRRSDCANHW